MGAYLSDGSVDQNGVFSLKVADEPFRDVVVSALVLLDVSYKTSKGWSSDSRMFRLWTPYHSKVGEWLRRTTRNKQSLPKVKGDILPELVAGVLDGDGGVQSNGTVYVYGGKGYLSDLIERLERFGVPCSGPYATGSPNCWKWRLSKVGVLKGGLFFRIPRKQQRLRAYAIRRLVMTYGAGKAASSASEAQLAAKKWLKLHSYQEVNDEPARCNT